MAEKAKDIKINLGLRSIEIRNISINKPADEFVDVTSLVFNIQIEQRLAPADRLLVVAVTVGIVDPKSQAQHATIGAAFGYVINNYEEIFYKDKEATSNVPAPLAEIVNSLSVGTMRGILFSELKGTYLKNVILPIIDPIQLKPGSK